jgi:O-antigen/teichoic acid export membrane protein
MPLSVEILVRGFFQSRYEMHYTYLLTLPGQALFVLLAALTIHFGGGLVAVMVISLTTGVLTVGLILWVAVPKMALEWRLDWELVRYLWRESWQLGAVILLFLLSMRLDQILLYWLRGPVDVARYAVAVKVTEALSLIPEAVMVTVFPLLASTEHSAPDRFQRIYHLTVRYLIVLVVPLALLVTLVREPLIRLLFGAEYVAGASAVALLAWWMFFPFTGAVYLNLMIVRGQQRPMAIVSFAAVLVNLLLNLILIPRWGGTGAAAATLVSSATSFALFGLVPQTSAAMWVCYVEAVRPLAAVLATAAVLWWITSPGLRLMVALPLYVMLLAVLGGIHRRDWIWVGGLWWPATPRA